MSDTVGEVNLRAGRRGARMGSASSRRPGLGWASGLCACALGSTVFAQPAPPPAAPPDVAGAVALLKLFSADAVPKELATSAYLNIRTTGDRTQLVRVSGALYASAEGPVREVYSYAAKLAGPLDPLLALRLLKESDAMLPKGAWVIVTTTDGANWIEFEDFMPDKADAGTVQTVVSRAARTADKLEAELTGKDDQ